MKAQRHHKSKQCFDINATPTKFDRSTTITVNGSQVTYEGTWYVYYTIAVKPNTDYYVNWEKTYVEIADTGTILIADSSGGILVGQQLKPFSFNTGANTSIRVQIYIARGVRATLILDHIMINEGTTPQPWEPYDPEVWHPCAVKRYASGGEQNTTSGTFTYKGLTLIKNRADIEVTGTSTDIISSTDQFFKDNFSVLLEAGKTYTIFGRNTVVDDSYIDIRYRDNDDIITTIGYYELPGAVTITPSTDTYIYMGIDLSAGVQCSGGYFTVNFYRQAMWHDTPVYIRERHPNIFDVDSVQNIIRNDVIITSGFSNVDGIITLTKSVGADGRYAYNELLSFEANEVYEIMFDVLLEGTNSSNLISIAVLDPSNMGAVSTDLFNYPVEKDTWTNIAEELTLSATQGALSIQARNTGNRIKIKNVILRKKGYTWNEQ